MAESRRSASRLADVSVAIRTLVESLSRKWGRTGRLTKKRAEVVSLLGLYRELLIILERITVEGIPAMASMDQYMKRSPRRTDAADVAIAQMLLARLVVDVKSLYHWSYAIERFIEFSSARGKVDLAELQRISIFRHKLMVHQAETPMRERGHVPMAAQSWGPDSENIRLVTHPIRSAPGVWRGYKRGISRLNRYVPGLKEEPNVWAKIDLIYRAFNDVPRAEQNLVRNKLFGAVGLTSDPPVVVAGALLTALRDYKRSRRL